MDEKAWREKLCDRVREVRRRLGLSQMEFAHKADLSHHTIGKIERREAFPDLITLIRLSEAHGVALPEFLGGTPKPTKRQARALRDITALLRGRNERTMDLVAGLLRFFLARL